MAANLEGELENAFSFCSLLKYKFVTKIILCIVGFYNHLLKKRSAVSIIDKRRVHVIISLPLQNQLFCQDS